MGQPGRSSRSLAPDPSAGGPGGGRVGADGIACQPWLCPRAFLRTCGHFEPEPRPKDASRAGRERGSAGALQAYARFYDHSSVLAFGVGCTSQQGCSALPQGHPGVLQAKCSCNVRPVLLPSSSLLLSVWFPRLTGCEKFGEDAKGDGPGQGDPRGTHARHPAFLLGTTATARESAGGSGRVWKALLWKKKKRKKKDRQKKKKGKGF